MFVTPNEWKGLPRPAVPAAKRNTASKCHDGKCSFPSTTCERVHGYSVRWHRPCQERVCGSVVFAVHGVDEAGKPALVRPAVPRAKLHELIASLPACTVAMEACTGAHHWARLFAQHGHTLRLIAPKFVTPYRMSGKRGKNDAEPGHKQS